MQIIRLRGAELASRQYCPYTCKRVNELFKSVIAEAADGLSRVNKCADFFKSAKVVLQLLLHV